MDHSAENIPHKDEQCIPTSCPDPAVPSTDAHEDVPDVPSTSLVQDASPHDQKQEQQPPSPTYEPHKEEPSSTAPDLPAENTASSPQLDSASAAQEQDPPPAESADRPSLFTTEAPDSVSSHSSPSSSLVSTDLPMPRASTAPSSARTSLTDIHASGSKPSGILRSMTLPRSASMTAVTFAPLPPTEPRRRASHLQLGVAARSRMLRARRTMRIVDPETGEPVPMHVVEAAMADHQYQVHYTYPAEEDTDDRYAATRGRRPPGSPYNGFWQSATQGMTTPEEDGTPEEDAFIALGKMMRDGAKFLWRKMSKSGGKGTQECVEGKKSASGEGNEDNYGTEGMRPGMKRSASEPTQQMRSTTGSESSDDTVTLRVEFTEPRHCFDDSTTSTPPPPVPSLDKSRPSAPESVEEAPPLPSKEEEVGRVWEEKVGDDVTRRLEVVAKEQEKEKEKDKRKSKLVDRIANRAPTKAGGKAKAQ